MATTQKSRQMGTKTAQEIVDGSFSRFEDAVQNAAQAEVRSMERDRELSSQLTDAFNSYLGSREPTIDLLDSFMRTQGNDLVYSYAEEKGYSLFSTFGVFGYHYSGGKLALEEVGVEGIDAFVESIKASAVDAIQKSMTTETGERGQRSEFSSEVLPSVEGTNQLQPSTLARLSELFNSSVGYEGDPGNAVEVSSLPRGKLPLVLTEEGTLMWSSGVLVGQVSF